MGGVLRMTPLSQRGTGKSIMGPRLDKAIADAEDAIANVHLVRDCPRCGAVIGERCKNVTRSYRRGRPLKHPHPQRYRGLDR